MRLGEWMYLDKLPVTLICDYVWSSSHPSSFVSSQNTRHNFGSGHTHDVDAYNVRMADSIVSLYCNTILTPFSYLFQISAPDWRMRTWNMYKYCRWLICVIRRLRNYHVILPTLLRRKWVQYFSFILECDNKRTPNTWQQCLYSTNPTMLHHI